MFEGSLLSNLLILMLFSPLLLALGVLIWRKHLGTRSKGQSKNSPQKQIEIWMTLTRGLLAARDEEGAIRTAMRSGGDFLAADGASFVPFYEWKRRLPPLYHGDLVIFQEPDWQTRLLEPDTRNACRGCEEKQAGSDCVLLSRANGGGDEKNEAKYVYCLPLKANARVIGVLNFYFSQEPGVSNGQKDFLSEVGRITALAIEEHDIRAQEMNLLRSARKPQDLAREAEGFDPESNEIFEELEFKTIQAERKRLAREIHDGLAQTLAYMKIETSRIQTYLAKGEIDQVSAMLKTFYQTISDLNMEARQEIEDLRQLPAEKLGDWLRLTLAAFHEQTGIAVDDSGIDLDDPFPGTVKIQLIRIVQEALVNIRKHAQASTVRVSTEEADDKVLIQISDDGSGFSLDKGESASQYGIRGMYERAEAIGAGLEVRTAAGKGTSIRVQVPIPERAKA